MRRTKRNGYTRGGEHLDNMETRDEEKFVLLLHSVHHHQGRVDVTYRMRTTGSYSDPLDRQLQERVNITSFVWHIFKACQGGLGRPCPLVRSNA